MRQLIALLFFALILSASATAQITAVRTAPQQARAGEAITVTISVANNGDSIREISVTEVLADADPIDTANLHRDSVKPGIIGFRSPYYSWQFTLGPGETKDITYSLRVTRLKDIEFGPATVTSAGETIETNPLIINVACNANQVCERAYDENSLNCAEDCPSGSEDGFCDLKKDRVCDPDCEGTADIDCIRCGDHKCEGAENTASCPADCKAACTGADCGIPEEEPAPLEFESDDAPKENKLLSVLFIIVSLAIVAALALFIYKRISRTGQ